MLLGGDDTLVGYGGDDEMWGGSGQDILRGMDENDRLDGDNLAIVGNHAYMVHHVNVVGGVAVPVILRNPWGWDGTAPKDTNAHDGFVTLTAQELVTAMWGNNRGIESANV